MYLEDIAEEYEEVSKCRLRLTVNIKQALSLSLRFLAWERMGGGGYQSS